ncbi:hypothetical protein BG000_009536 [Podila horticola]|nr:hypothetical protein BG000_009536 [Podila horticola]
MILGIGVDILHLPRLKGLLSRRPDRFLTRILTEVEQKEFKALQQQAGGADQEGPLRYLGARWALKEASYKALYPHHKLTWQDVTVAKQDVLIIAEKERFGIGKSHCSVSHDGEYLVGQVLLESP